ncbi:MAG: hypothetical protein HY074_04915 [Deltaproteobacteria bacterium]|nr:hypothetical protein [Deltaproteobacteria bacterium]
MKIISKLALLAIAVCLAEGSAAASGSSGYSKDGCESTRNAEPQNLKSQVSADLQKKAKFAYEHNHKVLSDAIKLLRDSTRPGLRVTFRNPKIQKGGTLGRTCPGTGSHAGGAELLAQLTRQGAAKRLQHRSVSP